MPIPSFTRAQLSAGAPGPETALTIGVLDGVHRGHQALLGRLRDEARKRALSPGVVTLHPHPMTVLRPEIRPSYLTSLEDRMELMRVAGADWVVPLTFTSEVSEISAEELARAFHQLLRMRLMVLGPDAAFGRGAPKDTSARMKALGTEIGFEVVQIEPLMHDHERYSSTAVRRTLGFPTANISVAADRALPALGVYATRAHVSGRTLRGATNIGTRPTFDAGHISIETYLLDFEGDIYGERMDIEIVHRIRGEVAFANVDDLKRAITADVAAVRE